MTARLHVGTMTAKGGAGLHPLHRSDDGGWMIGPAFPGAANASFAAYSPRHDLHYLVEEQRDGAIAALRSTDAGWQAVARIPTEGAEPCYVALNPAQDRLAAANYADGSIALFRLDAVSGLPMPDADLRRSTGRGPVAERQDGPHAHCVCFAPDGRWLYHVDLGVDAILAYPFNGTLGPGKIAYATPPGSGPRHLVFHPTLPLALLVCELASMLIVLAVEDGTLVPVHSLSTLPAGFAGDSIAGHLLLNRAGNRIYATNRGHDSVAVFAWPVNGVPILMQHIPSHGASPRAFVLLEPERLLVLANEESGTVVLFTLSGDGRLQPDPVILPVLGAVFPFIAGRQG